VSALGETSERYSFNDNSEAAFHKNRPDYELIEKRRETLWEALKMTPEEIETAKRACKDVKPLR